MLSETKLLGDLVLQYCSDYSELRVNYQSTSNVDFHREHGLHIKCPKEWQSYKVIKTVADKYPKANLFIVYGAASEYQAILNMLGDRFAGYISWQEIYVAIDRSGMDVRPMQKFRNNVENATYIFLLEASDAGQKVIDHLQVFANGCLILFD